VRKHSRFRRLYRWLEYCVSHLGIVRGLWGWIFLKCVKLYAWLIVYLARRAVFRYIPVISMWLVYFYRTWHEEDPVNDWEERWSKVEMIPYHKMDWRVIK
jgi:hypothetical protein